MRAALFGLILTIAGSAFALDANDDRVKALIDEGDRHSAEAAREFDIALTLFTQADRLAAGSTDPVLRATARQRRCLGLFNMSRLAEAVTVCGEAAALGRSAGDESIVGNATRIAGGTLIQLGQFEQAEVLLKESADISSRFGTRDQYARSLSNLSANFRNQGKLGDAIDYGMRAVEVLDRGLEGGETLTPRALFAAPFKLGKAMADAGDYVGSRTYLERAFLTAEKNSDRGGQLHVLFDTGEWYEMQGDFDRATRYYERSVVYSRSVEVGGENIGKSLRGLGRIAIIRGRFSDAVKYLTDAIDAFEDGEVLYPVPLAQIDRARARALGGDAVGAARDLERGIALARQRRQPAAIVIGLIERGREERLAGHLAIADRALREAADEAERSRLLPLLPGAFAGLGRIAEQSGNLAEAVTNYERAAAVLGRIHGRISSLELRSSFAAATHDTFAGLVRALLARNDREPGRGFDLRALDALEMERSHALALVLIDARTAGAVKDQSATARITQIQHALFSADVAEDRRPTLLRALDDAERDAALASTKQSETNAPLATVTDVVKRLSSGDVVLQFIVLPERADAFVVDRQSIRHIPLRVTADLGDRVEFFVRALESNARDASLASGKALSRMLMEPVVPFLKDVHRIHVIASGPLARLPFGALPIASGSTITPMLTRYPISYLPSFGLLARRNENNRAPIGGLLAVADAGGNEAGALNLAPLPGSRAEVTAVARRHEPARILTGSAATEDAVKTAVKEPFALIHLATHTVLDPAVPERSGVLLGPANREDGVLQAREILGLSFDGTLIMLSGCRTAAGAVSGAEGLRSLSRAFLQAGARSVIGSLWDLPDAAASSLVTRVSDRLADGDDVGAALQAAQVAGAGTDPYATSRSWAAMVVLGDPSLVVGGVPDDRSRMALVVLALLMTVAAAGYAVRRRYFT